jgi:hypothetical protein
VQTTKFRLFSVLHLPLLRGIQGLSADEPFPGLFAVGRQATISYTHFTEKEKYVISYIKLTFLIHCILRTFQYNPTMARIFDNRHSLVEGAFR